MSADESSGAIVVSWTDALEKADTKAGFRSGNLTTREDLPRGFHDGSLS